MSADATPNDAAARPAGTALIVVDDNYGDWSAAREQLCEWALGGTDPALVEPLLPSGEAAFVTKARHSIFYETPLDYLLRGAGVERLVPVRPVNRACILFSPPGRHAPP